MNDLDEIYKPKVLTDDFVENETCGVVDNFNEWEAVIRQSTRKFLIPHLENSKIDIEKELDKMVIFDDKLKEYNRFMIDPVALVDGVPILAKTVGVDAIREHYGRVHYTFNMKEK